MKKLFRHRPYLSLSLGIGFLTCLLQILFFSYDLSTKIILSWTFSQIIFLFLFYFKSLKSTEDVMIQRALKEDDGRNIILAMVIILAFVSFTILIWEMSKAKHLSGWESYFHAGLAFISIISSWLFTHSMFALHYAHVYYLELKKHATPGLDFPKTSNPDYYDFTYFSFIIGTSAQTADISITSKKLRKVGTIHCLFAFIFNTMILALGINIGSSLLQ